MYCGRYITADMLWQIYTAYILRQTYYGRHITADILQQIYYSIHIRTDILRQIFLRQIYYGRYMMADILRQMYYDRYITAGILQYIRYGRCIASNKSGPEVSIAVFEPTHCDRSPQGRPWTVSSIKSPTKSTKVLLDNGLSRTRGHDCSGPHVPSHIYRFFQPG